MSLKFTNLVMTIRASLLCGTPKPNEYVDFINQCMKEHNISFETKHILGESYSFDMKIKVSWIYIVSFHRVGNAYAFRPIRSDLCRV